MKTAKLFMLLSTVSIGSLFKQSYETTCYACFLLIFSTKETRNMMKWRSQRAFQSVLVVFLAVIMSSHSVALLTLV